MIQHKVSVLENQCLAERTFRIRLEDSEIGRRIRPGQFVMLKLPHGTDPLLARPFALYDTFHNDSGDVAGYDLVYLVVGKITTAMSGLKTGDTVEVWGPLGNGFSLIPTKHLVMVAGGIGQTPFPAVARAFFGTRIYGEECEVAARDRKSKKRHALATKITLCYGARRASLLAGLDDFRAIGVDIAVATDDGSAGHHGFVTDLVQQMLEGDNPPTRLMGCGPEPMMRALATLALRANLACELSLETPMACGIGACFSCVALIRQPNGEADYRRVCVEGPVFEASRIVFE